MSVIHIPRKHYAMPRGRASINPDSPLSVGARSAVLLNGANAYDLIDRDATLSLVGGATQGSNGVLLNSPGSCVRLTNALKEVTSGTVFLWVDEYAATQPYNFQMLWGNGGSVYCLHSSQSAATYNWGSDSMVATQDTRGMRAVGFAFSSGAGGAVHIGRNKFPIAGGALLPTAAKTIQIGLWQSNSNFQFFGVVSACHFVERVVTDDEISDWMLNPWGVYRADPVRIYSLPSGPISVTINSITASNITSSGARITLGLTR